MNILLISSFLPYPLFSGGSVRLYNIIKRLSKHNTITLVCEKRNNQTEKDVDALLEFCDEVITIERKKQWSIENILKTGLSRYPFLMVGHTNEEMKKKITALLARKEFDLIHVETFYVMQNLPKTTLPVVLVEHNIEYKVYQRFLAQLPFFLRPLLTVDIEKIKCWEKIYWKEATKLVAVSDSERSSMDRSDVVVVPNGVDVKKFKMKNEKVKSNEKKVLYIGDFKWIENRDAAHFILDDVWPLIRQQLPESILWIVGKNIPQSLKEKGDRSVVFDEHADDTVDIFSQADVLLAPIRVGGGSSFKILEAMATGVPVVTTPLGIEGMHAKAGEHVITATEAKELAQGVVRVLSDQALRSFLTKHARLLIEKEYDWDAITAALETVYKSAV